MRRYVAQRHRLPFIARVDVARRSASAMRGEQRRRRHDLAGLAVAALRHVELLPRALQRMRAVGRQPFDRRDRRRCSRSDTGVWHDRTGLPSTCTVHAPHWPMPQPNLVPFRLSMSRSTHSRGMSAATSTVVGFR